MSLLATACLNHAFTVVPAYLPTPAALAFWLTNPLLLAAHPALIAQRTEQYPGWSKAGQLALLTRLQSTRNVLRHTTPTSRDAMPLSELMALVDASDTLLAPDERASIRVFAFRLHCLERPWYYDFLRVAFRAREAALDEQHEQAA